MKISNVFAIYLIFVAVGMFGVGGVLMAEILDGDKMVEFLFIIPTVIAVLFRCRLFSEVLPVGC